MKLITLGTAAGNGSRNQANSSNLIVCGGKYYLFDAGEPVTSLIRSRKIRHGNIPHVFISHLHEDHFGGAVGFLKDFARDHRLWPESSLTFHLPEMTGRDALLLFMKTIHRPLPENRVFFEAVQAGIFFDDGTLKVTAYPTDHLAGTGPSYAYLLEGDGKRLLITGDLRADFSDFPAEALREPAWCLCEAAHCPMAKMFEILAQFPIRKLLLTHISPRYYTEKHELFRSLAADLPFESDLARDDAEYEL